MNINEEICVIGAGVNGLSTAVILQRSGYSVSIISKDDPNKRQSLEDFASTFPSASVIPHSVYSNKINNLFRMSLDYFKKLNRQQFPGVSIKEHYELFSYKKTPPSYLKYMNETELYEDFKSDWYPHHPVYKIHSGWRFHCYFAEWNTYYPALMQEYLDQGGKIIYKELQQSDIQDLSFSIIINCSGMGAVKLFEDPNNLLYRGHLLHIKNMPLLKNPETEQAVSYNLSPDIRAYSSGAKPIDVYCYPRSDGWILGGSRQKGILSRDGSWKGEENISPVLKINDVEFPAYILQLNQEIIKHSFGLTLATDAVIEAKSGYRYVRSKLSGLRLEAEKVRDKIIIHNYGHGGAGVTLSWGCALQVKSIVQQFI